MKYSRILLAVARTPWAMLPEKLAAMVDLLKFAAAGHKLAADEIAQRIHAARMHPNTDQAIARREGAIQLLPVHGVIGNRAGLIEDVSSGVGTSMEVLSNQLQSAVNDPDVKAIILDFDSPGGSVEGVPELGDMIQAAKAEKPIIAHVNAMAASAAYWLASQATELVVTPSGEVGSIGVYSLHEDISRLLEAEGVKPTFISAGKYKVEGNPFEPLSDEARSAIQARVDDYYEMFIDAVARGRGASASAVRDGFGQGRMVGASDAVSSGMADRVATLDQTLSRFGVNRHRTGRKASTPRANIAARELALLEAQ